MEEQFKTIPLGDLYESPLNTRKHFDEKALAELTESVRQKGVLVPLLVRDNAHKGKRFEILAGARRFRAATAAALDGVPVRVIEANEDEALEIVVLENLQREDVHPLEEAEGYRALLERSGYDVAAIAAKVGKSESYLYQRLKLLDLIPAAQKAFLEGEITAGHAVQIARLQPKDQKEALDACFDDEWNGSGRVKVLGGVRALTFWIEHEIHLDLGKVPFATDDANLVAAAGPCTTCPKRTGFSPALFPDVKKKDTCTDRSCFHSKIAAHVQRVKAEIQGKGERLVELSEQYQAPKGSKALGTDKWKKAPASGKNTCDNVVKGIMADGREVGTVLTVCTNPQCKKHRYGGSGYMAPKPSAAEQEKRRQENLKQRRDAEIRRRSFAALHTGAPKKLGRSDLNRLFAAVLVEMQHDVRKTLAAAFGIEPAKNNWGGSDYDGPLLKWALGLKDDELTRVLAVLPVIRELHGWGYGGLEDGEKLCTFKKLAADFDVDLGAVRKAVEAEFREKEKARAAREKKAADKQPPAKKAKAGSKGKKAPKKQSAGAAAQEPPEPAPVAGKPAKKPPLRPGDARCDKCGCTDSHACPGGCSWVTVDRKKHTGICSSCAPAEGAVQTSAATAGGAEASA